MWQQSNVDLLQHPRVQSECGQESSEAVQVVQCLPQLGPDTKATPLLSSDIRELGHLQSQNSKEITIGICNQLECPARRDLIAMVSHARPDATEILLDQMKIIA